MDKEIFVQNVKTLCLKKGIKPTNACKESGVGGSFISDINRGRVPSVASVQLLAQYLGVTVSDLLGEASPGAQVRTALTEHLTEDGKIVLSQTAEVILERIKDFEDSLDNEHEVAVKLASFGQALTLSVTDIGYSNPSTLIFHGYVDDQPATLIQHMSQLNFLLTAVKKSDPQKPPRRIGFSVDQEEQ